MKKTIFRISIAAVIFFAAFVGCATQPKEQTYDDRNAYQNTPQYQKMEAELDEMRNNQGIYFGEGIAEIGGDIAAAKDKAKQNALSELSSQIRIAIQADMEMMISGSVRTSGGKVSEDIQQTINSRTVTYTSQILSNVRGNKQYIDYPAPGYVTYFVYIDKAEYEEKVRRDLEIKEKSIRETIQNGDRAMAENRFANALQQWLNAQTLQRSFFDNMPIEGDVNNDGITEEFSAYLAERISRLVGNLVFKADTESHTYDSAGRLVSYPSVYLKYRDSNMTELPVPLFPLRVSFIEGYGRLPQSLQTDSYGQLTVAIDNIDSSKRVTRISVGIDVSAFQGLDRNTLPNLPSVEIAMEKLRTVAVSFAFRNNGSVSSPQDMKGALSSLVLGNELAVLEASVPQRAPTESDLQRVFRTNADYLLLIFAESGGAQTTGGYSNMFNASVSGVVTLYSLPNGEMVFSQTIPAQQGFGISAESAGWDGYGRIREDVIRLATQAVAKLAR